MHDALHGTAKHRVEFIHVIYLIAHQKFQYLSKTKQYQENSFISDEDSLD